MREMSIMMIRTTRATIMSLMTINKVITTTIVRLIMEMVIMDLSIIVLMRILLSQVSSNIKGLKISKVRHFDDF